MDTKAAVEQLFNPLWRELLQLQFTEDQQEQYENSAKLSKALNDTARSTELRINAADCNLLLQIGMHGKFPITDSRLILSWFWNVEHPRLAPIIEQLYGEASDGARSAAIVIVCCQEDPASVETLVRLLKQYGLPRSSRFFRELTKRHTRHASKLLPDLILRAESNIGPAMDFINAALERGHLEAAALLPLANHTESETERLLDQIQPLQQTHGTYWRYENQYQDLQNPLGVFLDLLGVTPGTGVDLLQRAVQLQDPDLVLFSIISLLKKGVEPPSDALALCARSHATREALYTQLGHRGRADLYPREFFNFDAFAAANMTEWLLHGTELGYEPLCLDLMAKITTTTDAGEMVTCLWKITSEGNQAFASVSGPYPANGPIGPLSGEDTYSNFTEWDSATPEQHLEGIVKTLGSWRVAWSQQCSPTA